MKRAAKISLFALSHGALFCAGFFSRFPHAAVPREEKNTAQRKEMPAARPDRSNDKADVEPPSSSEGRPIEDSIGQFIRMKAIFEGSNIKLLNDNGELSDAACFVFQLNPHEKMEANAALRELQEEMGKRQKASVSVVENTEKKQVYRIADFSQQTTGMLENATLVLGRIMGTERTTELLNGLVRNHHSEFCDFGKGDTRVSFNGTGERLQVIEEKLAEDGTCYASSQYSTENLPARYRGLFVIEQDR